MKKRMKVMGALLSLGTMSMLVLACSSSAPEPTGSTDQAISELSCAYRALGGSGEGTATSSWTVGCSGTSATSTDGLYGYTNCTHGFIWEVTAINSGSCGGRVIDTIVTPASNPTDQTNCQDTSVTYYLYGLDTVNDIQYAYSTNVSNVACSWSSQFGCVCNGSGVQLNNIDLDNWPDGNGGTLAVDGIRVVGQAYNSNLGAYVKVAESVSMYDYGSCCIHRPI